MTYRVASGGSVVEEALFPGTPHEMFVLSRRKEPPTRPEAASYPAR